MVALGRAPSYDGPLRAWNNDLVHDYHFTVYALSVKSLDLPKDFDAAAALDAMKGKILAQGEVVGLYSQNPARGAKAEKILQTHRSPRRSGAGPAIECSVTYFISTRTLTTAGGPIRRHD